MILIDGKKIATAVLDEIEQRLSLLPERKPGLAFILVGNHSASESYVRAKRKACAKVGIISTLIELPANVSQTELLETIKTLNEDPTIDGILVQLPLPRPLSESAVMLAIDPAKDVDGFHPLNMGKLLLGQEGGFLPCTPLGIKTLLDAYQISVSSKRVVIVGRSNIVGKPLAALLVQKRVDCNATVTLAHSQSAHLSEITKSADILIVAMGQPRFIRKEMVKPGSVVIDVGINRLDNGTIVGDVDFDAVAPLTSHITPVPGGVGPMTIAMLLQNTFLSYTTKDEIR